ncbi:MAG TPA: fused MFS/spermidine synthase [Gemmatimonadaceae bacterium]|nr:fused MFS/spermidine synthase [Gemmatimonadaceae bacterium]
MLPLLYFVFVLSGAAGLIYESIWTRYLGLFVGHSAYAQVIVLVIFLGGMSLGALLIGRRSERVRRPIFWYAMVELATGMIGLAFHDVFVAATSFAYASIFPSVGLGVAQAVAKWGLASLLILPQSILLGMTFPLMSAGVVRRVPRRTGGALATLYFANSLGAAGGVLLAGFWLVGAVGLPGTLLTAAMLNMAVALVVSVAVRTKRGGETVTAVQVAPNDATSVLSRPRLWRLLLAVSFGTALSSFIYEIGWIRMLALVLGSATHSFELMLSAFILGLALGALWVRRRADDRAASLRFLGLVQLAMGSLAVATLPVYVWTFQWMASFLAAFAKTPEGYAMFSISSYFICLTVMLPATFCAGMTLPLITRLLVGVGVGERAIGHVYGVNTLGSIVGAGVAGLVLMPLLGLKWLLVAGASIDIAIGVALLVTDFRRATSVERSRWMPGLSLAGALAAAFVFIALRAKLDRTVLTSGVYRYGTVQAPGSRKVLFYKDGRTATVSVRRIPDESGGGLTLATNGKPDASVGPDWLSADAEVKPGPFTHDTPTQLFVPLIALAHLPTARTAAVIGHGSGMTAHALLGCPTLQSVVTIEIEPEMINASRVFYPANARAFDDKRSKFVIDDARAYFAARATQFDLIVSEPSNPWVSGVSGLFTTEFYERISHYLTPGGVFAQWLHLYEIDDALLVSVIAALSQHFPTYSVFQMSQKDILVVATTGTTLPAPDWSIFQYPAIANDLRRVWPITARTMETLRVADSKSLMPLVRMAGAPNSDFYPTLDLNAERTRFMKVGATGFFSLASGRVNFAAMIDGRRNGRGDSYAVVGGIPRLQAMATAAGLLSGDRRAGPEVALIAGRKQMLDAEMSSGQAPADWPTWVRSAAWIEESLHGGMAGTVDAPFYASLYTYLDRAHAPAPARAAIDFLHGLATWDYAQAARAADPLLAEATRGELWLDPDELRDGAVIAKLKVGDRAGAAGAFRALMSQSARSATDLRTMLLYAYIADTADATSLAAR